MEIGVPRRQTKDKTSSRTQLSLPGRCNVPGDRCAFPARTVALAAPEVVNPLLRGHTAFLEPRSPSTANIGFQNFFSRIHRPFPQLRRLDDQTRQGGDRKVQCGDTWARSISGDPDLMSRTSPPSDPTSTSTHQPSARTLLSTQQPLPLPDKLGPNAISEASRSSVAVTSQSPGTAVGAGEARSNRSLDVQNILNPTQPGAAEPRAEVASSGQPPSVIAAPQTYASRPADSPPGLQEHEMLVSPRVRGTHGVPGGQSTRRMLRPKSPALRVASRGRLSLPVDISGQQPPLPPVPARRYAGDHGASQEPEVPPIPTPSTGSMFSGFYGFPSKTATPPEARRTSLGPPTAPLSQSASPSTSYSSFSQASRASPAPRPGLAAIQPPAWPYRASPLNASGPGVSAPSTPLPLGSSFRASALALAQGQQQVLTLDTEQGPIQVPVDVQAASKMADDKRKRNAGASARFRQRRKEKERESSQTIAKLEQQIRDLTEEREFYRQERNHFRQIAMVTPGNAPREPRPLSPARRRSTQSEGASIPETGRRWAESGSGGETERNTRRRTSAYPSRPMYPLPFPTMSASAGNMESGLPGTAAGSYQPLPPHLPSPRGPHGADMASKSASEEYGSYAPKPYEQSFPPSR